MWRSKELAWWQKLKGCVGRWCSVDLDSTAKATWCSKLSGGKARCKGKMLRGIRLELRHRQKQMAVTEVERRDVTSPGEELILTSYLSLASRCPSCWKRATFAHALSLCHSAGFQSVFWAFPSVWNDRRGKWLQCGTPRLSLSSKVRLPYRD